MRALETTLASLIALALGAGLVRLWDHRALPERARTTPRGEPHFARTFAASRFVKGNLHAHSTRSDGDASPYEVARWYRDHGYGFVALTDHNVLSPANDAELANLLTPGFTLVAGEEITMRGHGLPVHVNALCTTRVIAGREFPHAREALAYATGEVLAQGGVPLINHPNFDWALTEEDVVGADGAVLLEIASGHPYVHSAGDATRPSHEQLWDAALTAGRDLMGAGVDDVHHLATEADPPAFPGRAWVSVFADTPSEALLCDALRRGDLYASTGEELRRVNVDARTYAVEPTSTEATVTFLGSHGRVLAARGGGAGPATYTIAGGEGYVRARVESAEGVAWTPAVRVVTE